ncbi:MAG: putative S-layer protein [Candidatus Woesearchaeota archaeon]
MNGKNLVLFSLAVFVFALFVTAVKAEDRADFQWVKINGDEVDVFNGSHFEAYDYARGEDLEIKIRFKALQDLDDVQIEADIYGYRYSEQEEDLVSDTTRPFDMSANSIVTKTLNLKVPIKMDKDYFKLRIRVEDRDGNLLDKTYQLNVEGLDEEDAVMIKDVSFSPQQVMAGRAFTVKVKVKNYGNDDLEDLKATVRMPALNIEDSEFMDELNEDESDSFEELLLRIPECIQPGTYDVKVKIDFDEYETTEKTYSINVISDPVCSAKEEIEDRTTVAVPPTQDVQKGASVVYPVLITNDANVQRTYTIVVSGTGNWATTKIDPSSVIVVPAKSSKTVLVSLTALDTAEEGQKVFTLNVESGKEIKQIPLTANIAKGTSSTTDLTKVRIALQWGLIVLVIILIIIGLIVGFNKLKSSDNKEEETKTYY